MKDNKDEKMIKLLHDTLEEFGYKEIARECKSPQEREELNKEMDIFIRQIQNLAQGLIDSFKLDPLSLPRLFALNMTKLEQGIIKPGEIYKVKK